MLSNKQFDILAGLEKNGAMTQRALAGISGMSLRSRQQDSGSAHGSRNDIKRQYHRKGS